MNKNFFYLAGILFLGLTMLSGCTPYMKGSMQLERENYEAAIENFQEELSQNPDNWEARQRLGFAYMKSGQLDQAIFEFKAVIAQTSKESQFPIAFAYIPQNIKYVSGPGDPLSTYYLGMAYLQNGQRDKAIDTWRTYQNSDEPLVEREIKKQLTLLEIYDSLHLAKRAVEDEKKLQTVPPKSGSVAVFYFKDISPDQGFRNLQKAMAAMIVTDLSQVESLQVIERVRVQYLLEEMQLGTTGVVGIETAPRAGRLLGAEKLIVGTMEPGSFAVKTSVASTTTEDVVGAFSVTAEEQQFYILQKEIVYNILNVLEVSFTPLEEKRFSKYHTKSLQAVTYFGQGLNALDTGEWKEAKNFFKMAVDEDPEFRLARYYRDASPAATAPSLAALSEMSETALAGNCSGEVDGAIAAQGEIGSSGSGGGPSQPGAPEPPDSGTPASGSVSVTW
jgi:tetratricopeptide (TPR) repeat protein